LLFFPLGIAGIVLSSMGLSRIPNDLPSAHRLMRASWLCFAAAPVAVVLLLLFLSIAGG
jgi:hypothetical protein